MDRAWITESTAVERIGCSIETLRTGAHRGQLTTTTSPFTGERLYDAEEIDRLATLVSREIVRRSR